MTTSSTTTTTAAVRWPNILLLGDSQTQEGYSAEGCWVSIVSDYYQRRCDVINRGFTGYNSRWLRIILPDIINPEMLKNCAAVTILLGSNDANTVETTPNLHVPLTEFKANIKEMCNILMAAGLSQEKIILITPPPVDVDCYTSWLAEYDPGAQNGLHNEIIQRYTKSITDLSTEIGVKCIDLFSEMVKDKDWKRFVNIDGLHLAKEGGQLLARLLIKQLESSLTKDILQLYPDWSRVDNSNPTVSLANIYSGRGN